MLTSGVMSCYTLYILIATCSGNFTTVDWVGPLLLCEAELRRIPEAIPGVYLLHAFVPAAGGYPVVYAGQSCDLRRRLLRHAVGRTAKPIIRVLREVEQMYWSAAPIADAVLRARYEAGLIRLLMPSCNDQIPAAPPVVANLPPISLGS